jgi:hypothetical protein
VNESPDGPSLPPDTPPREPVNLRRHLLFGLSLLLAFGSIYAGILGGGNVLQYGLAIASLVVVLFALLGSATRRG